MKKAMLCLAVAVVVMAVSVINAHQDPAPCSGFVTLEPNEVPFGYDPNFCEAQLIGYFDMYAGQRASCSINVCVPSDEPIEISLVNAPTDMVYDPNTWTLSWPTSSDDNGLYYVKLRGRVSGAPPVEQYATILFNIKSDRRPRFELIVPLVD